MKTSAFTQHSGACSALEAALRHADNAIGEMHKHEDFEAYSHAIDACVSIKKAIAASRRRSPNGELTGGTGNAASKHD
mgnify:CR=1 FL=1